MENDSKTAELSLVVSGSLQRHQVRQYLDAAGVEWKGLKGNTRETEREFTFRFSATDEQWDQIQAWMKKVTG